MNMSKVPQKEEKRNRALIDDYCSVIYNEDGEFVSLSTGERVDFKYTTAEIVSKYKVSAPRIYQILDSYGVARRSKEYVRPQNQKVDY